LAHRGRGERRALEQLPAMPRSAKALHGELSRPDMQDRIRHLREGLSQMSRCTARRLSFAVAALAAACALGSKEAAAQMLEPPLKLEAKIPLGSVAGRIDHMAFDLGRNRLFVAELGNNSVGVVDISAGKVIHRIGGLKEPQGVGYADAIDALYVANRGDGSVRIFRGSDYALAKRVELNSDADNVRIDRSAERVIVGYGEGGLAAIEMRRNDKVADMPLKAHPESFQLDPVTSDVFVNLPDGLAMAVMDRATGKTRQRWVMPHRGNFAMALDNEAQRVLTVFRDPARLAAFAKESGRLIADVGTCGDVDDLFVDAKRKRVYISCGEGFIDVRDASSTAYPRLDRIATVSGARTSLFVPESGRFFLAVRAQSGEPAAIWVYKVAEIEAGRQSRPKVHVADHLGQPDLRNPSRLTESPAEAPGKERWQAGYWNDPGPNLLKLQLRW
jgi:hypothetical protein